MYLTLGLSPLSADSCFLCDPSRTLAEGERDIFLSSSLLLSYFCDSLSASVLGASAVTSGLDASANGSVVYFSSSLSVILTFKI